MWSVSVCASAADAPERGRYARVIGWSHSSVRDVRMLRAWVLCSMWIGTPGRAGFQRPTSRVNRKDQPDVISLYSWSAEGRVHYGPAGLRWLGVGGVGASVGASHAHADGRQVLDN